MSNASVYDTLAAAPPAGRMALGEHIATDFVARWLASCREFLDWHRAQVVAQEPSPEIAQASERVHPWMIRTTRLILCQMLDPGLPQPALARRVEATLWQLQEAWEQAHNPMTEAEAEAILAQVFPAHGT